MREASVAPISRWVGRYDGGRPGPTVLVCAGLHGNEPAGVEAARRVVARLARERPPLRGRLLAVAGNLGALAAGRRFLEKDLNRCWLEEEVEALLGRDPARDRAEDAEQRALLGIVEEAARAGPLVCLDLHTTSADSAPFTLMSDTLANRRVGFGLPVPVVLGLEENVDGTLLDYLTRCGHVAAAVEGGRHDDPRAADLHEAVVWTVLEAVGAGPVPEGDFWRRRLVEACRGLPRVLEVRHRHALRPGDGFRMRPGYRGFQPVRRSEVVAEDGTGEIRAPAAGLLLMPLYQRQGSEGFFVVRRVRRFWLAVSAVLRRLGVRALLPLLPGVRRHPEIAGAFRVDPRVARWLTTEVFHLLGYRRSRPEGRWRVFTRRR